jgi:hypothetical protein
MLHWTKSIGKMFGMTNKDVASSRRLSMESLESREMLSVTPLLPDLMMQQQYDVTSTSALPPSESNPIVALSAPNTVTGFDYVTALTTYNSVSLTWDVGVPTSGSITGYRIEYRLQGSAEHADSYTTAYGGGRVDVSGGANLARTITGLWTRNPYSSTLADQSDNLNGTTYLFRIQAISLTGTTTEYGAWTSLLTVKTLNATPNSLRVATYDPYNPVTVLNPYQVQLQWDVVDKTVDKYEIRYKLSSASGLDPRHWQYADDVLGGTTENRAS